MKLENHIYQIQYLKTVVYFHLNINIRLFFILRDWLTLGFRATIFLTSKFHIFYYELKNLLPHIQVPQIIEIFFFYCLNYCFSFLLAIFTFSYLFIKKLDDTLRAIVLDCHMKNKKGFSSKSRMLGFEHFSQDAGHLKWIFLQFFKFQKTKIVFPSFLIFLRSILFWIVYLYNFNLSSFFYHLHQGWM